MYPTLFSAIVFGLPGALLEGGGPNATLKGKADLVLRKGLV